MPTPPADHQPRPLAPRERAVLTSLLQRGEGDDHERVVTTADRTRWLGQVPRTLAGRPCGCGTCPSIELTDTTGRTPASADGRVVLTAGAPSAVLLLFVDEDRLSYLELAPLDPDVAVTEFPEPADLRFR